MKKRFVKKRKINLFNVFIFLLMISFLFKIFSIKISFNDLVKYMLSNTNNYIIKSDNIFSKVLNMIIEIDTPIKMNKTAFKTDNKILSEGIIPRIYIYNTHPQEEYLPIEGYNLNPKITDASILMQESFNKQNINTLVETSDLTKYLDDHNMNFYQSYIVSRIYVKDKLDKYPELSLIIDLHRDALNRENSYLEIDNKKYAKVLFVVGKKYDTYAQNLELVNKINYKINLKYPKLSRGIIIKDKEEQNGIYNQDLNNKMILLELGSNNNYYEEVSNTILLLTPILIEVINET